MSALCYLLENYAVNKTITDGKDNGGCDDCDEIEKYEIAVSHFFCEITSVFADFVIMPAEKRKKANK